METFRPDGWGDITKIHEFYLNNNFCYPIKVITENKIVGIGTAIYLNKTGWLAHIIVLPEFRNKGMGNFIVESLKNKLINELSCESISLIATDLGFPVYIKNGFISQSEYCTYKRKIELKQNYRVENFILTKNEHINEIFQLDREISGEDRSRILKQYVYNSFLHISKNKVNGFYLPNLGEGLIVSNEKDLGTYLLSMQMEKKDTIVVPVENETARDTLLKNGYKETMKIRRMVFGKLFKWAPEKIYSRVGGYIG